MRVSISILKILIRAQPGERKVIEVHARRAEQVARAIGQRWGSGFAHPYHWRLKHVRWYLQIECQSLAPATRHDHWRTIRVVLAAIGRLPDWEPRLRGPWCYKSGQRGTGIGGRPAKLAHRARMP